jgi:hypothetical protein
MLPMLRKLPATLHCVMPPPMHAKKPPDIGICPPDISLIKLAVGGAWLVCDWCGDTLAGRYEDL